MSNPSAENGTLATDSLVPHDVPPETTQHIEQAMDIDTEQKKVVGSEEVPIRGEQAHEEPSHEEHQQMGEDGNQSQEMAGESGVYDVVVIPVTEPITEGIPALQNVGDGNAEQEQDEIGDPRPEIQGDSAGAAQPATVAEPSALPPEAGTVPAQPRLLTPPDKKPAFTQRKFVAVVLLVLLLAGIVTPLVVAAAEGVQAYTTYTALRTHASSGIHHLLSLKSVFSDVKGHPTEALSDGKLTQAKREISAARTDFTAMQTIIDHTDLIRMLTQYLPQYRPLVTTARAGSQIGVDVSNVGLLLIASATQLAPTLRSPLLSNTSTPLVTQSELDLVSTTITAVLPYLDDIQKQSHDLSLDALPSSMISSQQRSQLQEAFLLLPRVEALLVQGRDLLPSFGWLLGVGSPRTFLVQTMDRSELRPTGGFTGQYGELQLTNGRMAPFSLRDISLIEYADNSPTADRLAPDAYRSWWPFANWGLRDSNLSANFPTSARIAIQQYNYEVHRNVDGVILFTPFLIEHILQIIGPIQIPEYHETITAQNLENRLHYYQLDNAGIAKQQQMQVGDTSTSDRKRFTALVAKTLLDQIRHASTTEMLAIAHEIPHDLQTRDLQVYITNTQLENVLAQYGYAGQVDRSATHDGLYVVQANVSASKASQYVRTSMHDVVTLDDRGGATHVLQLRLAYTQIGPVYGLDTYRDYVRIYVPTTVRFLAGTGFDTGQPLCGGPLAACADKGVYAHQELVCPTGGYLAGAAAPMLGDPYMGAWHPLDTIGPPTNFKSDEPGRNMFGGYIVVPKNCTMTATVSWYVPAMSKNPYQLLVQRQAGTFPELDLTVLPTPGNCSQLTTPGMHFDGVLGQDTSFTLPTSSRAGRQSCYAQTGV